MLEQFIAWAREHGWQVETAQKSTYTLPEEVIGRYSVPEEYRRFLSYVKTCVSPEDTKWFLCSDDYAPQPEDTFRWNEFEIISLGAAGGDTKWAATIKDFWDSHFPFFMSVDGDYEYCAFDLADSSIVKGYEPEFEETSTVARSFDEFLAKVISGEMQV